MERLPAELQDKIDRFLPVTMEGITVYPVQMAEGRAFDLARPALEFLQQSLPVALMGIPLLDAYYQMDTEAYRAGKPTTGLFGRACLLLCLALRLGRGMDSEERISRILPMENPEKPMRLSALLCVSDDGKTVIRITPKQFGRLRPILAAQNGVTLESDDANPELVEAERALAEAQTEHLEPKLCDKVTWVALRSGVDETEIDQWPILKFERRAAILKRELDYLIFGIGEASGMVKYKNGSPCPSPYFARRRNGSAAMIPLDSYMGGSAAYAVNKQTSR